MGKGLKGRVEDGRVEEGTGGETPPNTNFWTRPWYMGLTKENEDCRSIAEIW